MPSKRDLKKAKAMEERRRKDAIQRKPGESSNYARKSAYLRRTGRWGWEFAIEDKPWK